jgi:hypothetical protein
MPPNVRGALVDVINYFNRGDEKQWEDSGCPENGIWARIWTVRDWLQKSEPSDNPIIVTLNSCKTPRVLKFFYEGKPVFADDQGATWVIGDDGRWQPASAAGPDADIPNLAATTRAKEARKP